MDAMDDEVLFVGTAEAEHTEMYLKAIWHIREKGDDVKISTIAKRLNVRQPSVVQMLKKLSERDLVTYNKAGVSLKESGEKVASSMIRNSRLLEVLMESSLKIEIGTYTGYSALCIAEGLESNGIIHTIDNNEELTYIQNKYFKKSNYRSNIKQYYGDAIKILPRLNITFDFAFIDADKINYINYFEMIIKKMKKGGLIISDNVLWSGKVLEEKNSKDEETEILKKFNSMLKKDERITNLIIPLRDGLSVSQVN